MESLLELQEKKIKLQRKVNDLIAQDLAYTADYANADFNLRDTQNKIDAWGKEQAVYRII